MVEALYTRADYDYRWFIFFSPSSGVQSIDEKHAASRWDFPLLLKYQMTTKHSLRPFVTAGLSIQYSRNYTVGGLLAAKGVAGGVFLSPYSGGPSSKSATFGPTVGAGFTVGRSHFRPSLEFRYTRWANPPLPTVPGFPDQPLAIHSALNQAQVLAGIMF